MPPRTNVGLPLLLTVTVYWVGTHRTGPDVGVLRGASTVGGSAANNASTLARPCPPATDSSAAANLAGDGGHSALPLLEPLNRPVGNRTDTVKSALTHPRCQPGGRPMWQRS